jgi:hypothetical protein
MGQISRGFRMDEADDDSSANGAVSKGYATRRRVAEDLAGDRASEPLAPRAGGRTKLATA